MADFDTELDLFSFIPAEPVPEPPPPRRPARRKPAHRELQQLCFGFLWRCGFRRAFTNIR